MAENRQAVQAAISSNDTRARTSVAVLPPEIVHRHITRTPGLTPKVPRGKLKSSLAASGMIEEEELAALFRNNMLRSCWKPGHSTEKVQRLLNAWEARVLEVLHLLIHPMLYKLFARWRRRGWSLRKFGRLRERSLLWLQRRALKQLRSHARIETLRPFLDEQRLQFLFARWRASHAERRRLLSPAMLYPFRQVRLCRGRMRG